MHTVAELASVAPSYELHCEHLRSNNKPMLLTDALVMKARLVSANPIRELVHCLFLEVDIDCLLHSVKM